MKYEPYQGWYNPQTWCVVLAIDNEPSFREQVLGLVRDNREFPNITQAVLIKFTGSIVDKIYETAPWAWADGESLKADVNWTEIYAYYVRKVDEGVISPRMRETIKEIGNKLK